MFDTRARRYRPPDERRFEQIIGGSPAVESVLEQSEGVAPTQSTVLIAGETGTGKELILRLRVLRLPHERGFECFGGTQAHRVDERNLEENV